MGTVAAVVGTLLTYLGVLALLGGFLFASAVLSQSGAEPAGAVAFVAAVGHVAVVLTAPVTVPIGCLTD